MRARAHTPSPLCHLGAGHLEFGLPFSHAHLALSVCAWVHVLTYVRPLIRRVPCAVRTVAPLMESVWKIVAAILHLGNAKFKGADDDDAEFESQGSMAAAAGLLGCVNEQLTKAICTLNIKAGLDWIAKPNTTRYAQSAKDVSSAQASHNASVHMLAHAVSRGTHTFGCTLCTPARWLRTRTPYRSAHVYTHAPRAHIITRACTILVKALHAHHPCNHHRHCCCPPSTTHHSRPAVFRLHPWVLHATS